MKLHFHAGPGMQSGSREFLRITRCVTHEIPVSTGMVSIACCYFESAPPGMIGEEILFHKVRSLERKGEVLRHNRHICLQIRYFVLSLLRKSFIIIDTMNGKGSRGGLRLKNGSGDCVLWIYRMN